MTEVEWLASVDPVAMLRLLTGEEAAEYADGSRAVGGRHPAYSHRKLRLFACACACEAWDCQSDPARAAVVNMAERVADGTAGEPASERASVLAPFSGFSEDYALAWTLVQGLPEKAAQLVVQRWREYGAAQAALLRDVVGNPWKPVARSAAYLSPTILALAHATYDLRREDGTLDPYRLAVLADALEEEGCEGECIHCQGRGKHRTGMVRNDVFGVRDTRQDIRCVACQGTGRGPHPILAHLRSPGPHVRGCAALDTILGRS